MNLAFFIFLFQRNCAPNAKHVYLKGKCCRHRNWMTDYRDERKQFSRAKLQTRQLHCGIPVQYAPTIDISILKHIPTAIPLAQTCPSTSGPHIWLR